MMPRIQPDSRISRRSPPRGAKAPVGSVIGTCLAALLVAFALPGPLDRVAHAITDGHHGADVAAGAVLVFVPLAVVGLGAWSKWRRARPVWPAAYGLVLLAPAAGLAQYSHGPGADETLSELLTQPLPGLKTGMSIGLVAFVACALLAVPVAATLRGRQSRQRREAR